MCSVYVTVAATVQMYMIVKTVCFVCILINVTSAIGDSTCTYTVVYMYICIHESGSEHSI